MEHKGVEVSFIDPRRNPQVFKSANCWSISDSWLSIVERMEFKVVTREKTRKGTVETESTETKDNTIAMFPISGVFHVKHPDLD